MSANAPAVNVRPATCPNCGREDAVIPTGMIRDEEEPTILFSISYECTFCGEQYDPST